MVNSVIVLCSSTIVHSTKGLYAHKHAQTVCRQHTHTHTHTRSRHRPRAAAARSSSVEARGRIEMKRHPAPTQERARRATLRVEGRRQVSSTGCPLLRSTARTGSAPPARAAAAGSGASYGHRECRCGQRRVPALRAVFTTVRQIWPNLQTQASPLACEGRGHAEVRGDACF